MDKTYEKSHTCCFTGPRPHKLSFLQNEEFPQCVMLKKQLTEEILSKAVQFGCDTFLSGMARGVDMICAQLVIDLRSILHMPMRLVCVIPYPGQAKNWPSAEQERYREILSQAERKILVSREYTRSCIMERNRYMVDHSAHMVAVYGGAGGGTKYTLDYARRENLCISLIDPYALDAYTRLK